MTEVVRMQRNSSSGRSTALFSLSDTWSRRLWAFAAAASLLYAASPHEARGAEKAGTIVAVKGVVLLRSESGKATEPQKLRPGDAVYEGQIINTASDASAKILLADKSIVDIGPTTLFNVEKFKLGNNTESRQAQFGMEYGSVRALVSKNLGPRGNFRVRTRSATMGVRGTEFVVMNDLIGLAPAAPSGNSPGPADGKPASQGSGPPQMKVVVLEGKVEVTGKAVENSENKMLTLTEGTKVTTDVVMDKNEQKQAEEAGDAPPAEEQAAAEPKEAPKVEQASAEEVKETKEVAKVEDNTFKREITIDKQNGPGSGIGVMKDVALSLPSDFALPPMDALPPTTAHPDFLGLVGQYVRVKVKFNP
ncbi:MAG: FecR domain-containing protein [Bdellovibrionales bacterium]|nr:FecR domain-containing protein [Bdellovibrionales bacterium]